MLFGEFPVGVYFFAGVKDIFGVEDGFDFGKEAIDFFAKHFFEIVAAD